MAFLDGPPPTRLCQPMVDYIRARGGEVILNAPVREFVLHREVREMAIDGFRLANVSGRHYYYYYPRLLLAGTFLPLLDLCVFLAINVLRMKSYV